MEVAGALAKSVQQEIQRQDEALLRRVDTRESAKEAWTSASADKNSRQS